MSYLDKPEYLVGKNKIIIFKTRDRDLLNRFTDALCDSYDEYYDDNDGHEVYIKDGDKYLYSHATWLDGCGNVTSRGVSPKPDQTEYFIEKYGEVK